MQHRSSIGVVILAGAAMLASVTGAESRTHDPGSSLVPRIVARALPAVVSITTPQIEYDQFNQPASTRGLGSGFLLDRVGHVLTNNHVVEGGEEIKVALTDGRVFRAAGPRDRRQLRRSAHHGKASEAAPAPPGPVALGHAWDAGRDRGWRRGALVAPRP